MSQESRIALVTGAARGIGREIALRLADDGIDVAVNDIASSAEGLAQVKKEIEEKGRRSVVAIADVSSEDEVKGMVEKTVEALGGLDIVCHYAECLASAPIALIYDIIDGCKRGNPRNRTASRESALSFLCTTHCLTIPLDLQVSVESWDRVISINLRGVMLCYRYAALQMIKQGRGGRILGVYDIVQIFLAMD